MLSQFAVSQIFAFLLIFTRIGTCLMVLPGLGEVYIMARARLLLALMLSLLMVPLLGPHLPPMPPQISGLALLLICESIIGFFIGAICRIIISGIHTAGVVIATQSGLAAAMMIDITQSGQSTVVSNILVMTALALIFVLDIHHLMLQGLVDSYTLFLPGHIPPPGDMSEMAAMSLVRAFRIGLQLSSPHIVIAVILTLGGGILARLMPTIQIFFIIMAPQIMLALFVLFTSFGAIMLWYMNYVERSITSFLIP